MKIIGRERPTVRATSRPRDAAVPRSTRDSILDELAPGPGHITGRGRTKAHVMSSEVSWHQDLDTTSKTTSPFNIKTSKSSNDRGKPPQDLLDVTARIPQDASETSWQQDRDMILKIYSERGDTRTSIFVKAQWIIKIRK